VPFVLVALMAAHTADANEEREEPAEAREPVLA
jgi:hypothetical protein